MDKYITFLEKNKYESKKVYIFDLDNTIFDELEFLSERLSLSLNSFNNREIPKNLVLDAFNKYYIENGNTKILDFLLSKFEIKISVNDFREILCRPLESDFNLIYKWVNPFFSFLLNSHKKIYICTNGKLELQNLKLNLIDPRVRSQISMICCDKYFKKPNPYHLKEICIKENIDSHEAIMIGDSASDSLAAKEANIEFLHVKQLVSEIS